MLDQNRFNVHLGSLFNIEELSSEQLSKLNRTLIDHSSLSIKATYSSTERLTQATFTFNVTPDQLPSRVDIGKSITTSNCLRNESFSVGLTQSQVNPNRAMDLKINSQRNTNLSLNRETGKTHISLDRQAIFKQFSEFSKDYPNMDYQIYIKGEMGYDLGGLTVESLNESLKQMVDEGLFKEDEKGFYVVNVYYLQDLEPSKITEAFRSVGHIFGQIYRNNISGHKKIVTSKPFSDSIYQGVITLGKMITENKNNPEFNNFINRILSFEDNASFIEFLDKEPAQFNKMIKIVLDIDAEKQAKMVADQSAQPDWINDLGGINDETKSIMALLALSYSSDNEMDLLQDLINDLGPVLAMAYGFNEVNQRLNKPATDSNTLRDNIYSNITIKDRLNDKSNKPFIVEGRRALFGGKHRSQAKEYVRKFINDTDEKRLKDFTSFVSGSEILPKNEKVKIKLLHNHDLALPRSQTCFNSLYVDVSLLEGGYDLFEQKLIESINYSKVQGNSTA
jgi:hypothetical protein